MSRFDTLVNNIKLIDIKPIYNTEFETKYTNITKEQINLSELNIDISKIVGNISQHDSFKDIFIKEVIPEKKFSFIECMTLIMKGDPSTFSNNMSIRKNPHNQSRKMFDYFKGKKIIEASIDISKINSELFGEHVIQNYSKFEKFKNYNNLYITGPEELIQNFINQKSQDRKLNIFIPSVRTTVKIDNVVSLCRIPYNKLENYEENKKEIDDYIRIYGTTQEGSIFEDPITQQYCNFYNFFENEVDYNYTKDFVVIFTNKTLIPLYKVLFPHFIFIAQPDVSHKCVGLTRYTTIAVAYLLGLDRVVVSDDNIININTQNYDYIEHKKGNSEHKPFMKTSMTDLNLLRVLIKKDRIILNDLNTDNKQIELNVDDYGYLGSSATMPSYASWVQISHDKEYFRDYESEPIHGKKLIVRDYINKDYTNRFPDDIPYSELDTKSFINPHRLKLLILNIKVLYKYKISYNPTHTMTEDLYFSKEIFLKKIKTVQFSFNYSTPKLERRPATCTNVTDSCVIDHENNLLESSTLTTIKSLYPFRAELFSYKGGLIFFNKNSYIGNAGTYGPAKILQNNMVAVINDKINKSIDADKSITLENKESCKQLYRTKHMDYINKTIHNDNNIIIEGKINYMLPNKFQNLIYDEEPVGKLIHNHPFKMRKNTAHEYFRNNLTISYPDAKDKPPSTINIYNTENEIYYKHFINNYIKYYDIVSILANNQIAKFGGMEKYLRDYEYENILSFQHFINFYEDNKDIVDPVYLSIQSAKSDKDKCNRNNDIIIYFDNYNINSKGCFKMFALFVIYTKLMSIEKILLNEVSKFIELLPLLFGNINDYIYNNELCNYPKLRKVIISFMTNLIDKINKDTLDMIKLNKEIQDVYNYIKTLY
jgi:hypothetical protein